MTDTAIQVLGRKIDSELIQPLRETLVGRRLAAINPLSKGDDVFEVEAYSYSDLGDDALVEYDLPDPDGPTDELSLARNVVKVPVFSKGFRIGRATYDIFKSKGTPIDITAAQSAAFVVAKKEDRAIIDGWKGDGTNYGMKGLYQLAGNSYTTSKPFSVFGNATAAVGGAIALIEADDAEAQAYNLTLNAAQRGSFGVSQSTTGIMEEDIVLKLLNPNGGTQGQIIKSKAITASTGMVTPVDPSRRYIELHCPRDFRTSLGVNSKDEKNSPIYGRVSCMTYVNVKFADAICTMTQI